MNSEQILQQLKEEAATLTPEQKLKLLNELNDVVAQMNADVKDFLASIK